MNYDILYLYLIHSDNLVNRKDNLISTSNYLKNLADEINLKININIVNCPDLKFIEENKEKYNQKIININNIEDNFFKNTAKFTINYNQLSNLEKHKNVYNIISKINNNKALHLIIEDDLIINMNNDIHLKNFFKFLQNTKKEWDIIFTSFSDHNNNDNFEFIDIRNISKILLAKSSYFINKETAINLLNSLNNNIKYSLRISLSEYINNNINCKSYITNKHLFIEGSKLGIFPTTINTNNFLFQNNDYLLISKYLNNNNISIDDLKNIENIYNKSNFKNNPDILHSMGLIYYKYGDYDKSKEFLINAINNLKKNDGYIDKYSDILNNCINMFQYNQISMDECLNKPSKYIYN